MLSDRWNKTDEAITITKYSFDDFKELLTFIYSGGCSLTNSNIRAMVDMAEFYSVQVLKDICEEFLIKINLNIENSFGLLEFAIKYSLTEVQQFVHEFISKNLSNFLQSAYFINLKKSAVKEIVKFNQEIARQDELFEIVYKWAENQAKEKQKWNETLELNTIIKDELADILPFFKFEKMTDLFLILFVVRKSFLFSGNELSSMLCSRTKIYVKIIDGNGKIMKGELVRENAENVAAVIRSKKDNTCEIWCIYRQVCHCWQTNQPKPTSPSKLIKNDNVEWYLVYDCYGNLAVKNRNNLWKSDYLLAEMFAENGFKLSNKCKIEAFCFV